MTMHVNWTDDGHISARDDRNLTYALVGQSAGVLERGHFRVTAAASGLKVNIAPGDIFITGDSINRQGTYHVWSDAQASVQLNGAPAAQTRFDVVGIQVIDSEYDAAASQVQMIYLPGVPGAGGPVSVADQPGTVYNLAVIEVRAGATSIADPRIADRREIQRPRDPMAFLVNKQVDLGLGNVNPNRVINADNIRLDRAVDLLSGPLFLGIEYPPNERTALDFNAFLDLVGGADPGTPNRIDALLDPPWRVPNGGGNTDGVTGQETVTLPCVWNNVPNGVWSVNVRVNWSGSAATGTRITRLMGVLTTLRQGPVS